jgi:hypothetical protein
MKRKLFGFKVLWRDCGAPSFTGFIRNSRVFRRFRAVSLQLQRLNVASPRPGLVTTSLPTYDGLLEAPAACRLAG